MAFQQGLSGLSVAAKTLEVIGNNIANAAVAGFKGSSVQFGDIYASSLGQAGAAAVGIGSLVQSVSQQFIQGNITNTNNPLDVAIHGNGFFRLSDQGNVTFTRNGQFHLENDGTIANASGDKLTGWAETLQANQQTPTTISILKMDLSEMKPIATSKLGFGLNLNMAASLPANSTFSITDPTSYTNSTSATLYDTRGAEHSATLFFAKTAAGYDLRYSVDGVLMAAPNPTALTFNASGIRTSADKVTVTPPVVALPLVGPGAFVVDMTSWTGFASKFSVSKIDQDGQSSGRLSNFAISDIGEVLGHYDNGRTKSMGQIALVNFPSVAGLLSDGANQWKETFESGKPFLGAPGDSGFGSLQASATEDSNVDLTVELVQMITAQRIYQANAQSIKTQDQILQTLVNLR